MNELSIQDMRQLLRERGLNSRGSKKQLQGRLADLYSLQACANTNTAGGGGSSSSSSNSSGYGADEKTGKEDEKKLRITITKSGTAKSTSMLLTLSDTSAVSASGQATKLFQSVVERAANKFRFKAKRIFLQASGEEVLATNFLDLVRDGALLTVTAGQPLTLTAAQKLAMTATAATAATQSPSQSPALSPDMSPQSPALLGSSFGISAVSNGSGSMSMSNSNGGGSPLLQSSPSLPPRLVPFAFGAPLIGPSTCSSASLSSCDSQTSQSHSQTLFFRSSPSLTSTPYSPTTLTEVGFPAESDLSVDALDLNGRCPPDHHKQLRKVDQQQQHHNFRSPLFDTPTAHKHERVIFQSSYHQPSQISANTGNQYELQGQNNDVNPQNFTPLKATAMIGLSYTKVADSNTNTLSESPSSSSSVVLSSSLSTNSSSASKSVSLPSSAIACAANLSSISCANSSSSSSSSSTSAVPPAWFTSINRENSSILINLLHSANAEPATPQSTSTISSQHSAVGSGPSRVPAMANSFSHNGAMIVPFQSACHCHPLESSIVSPLPLPLSSGPPALALPSTAGSTSPGDVPQVSPSPSNAEQTSGAVPNSSVGSAPVSVDRDRRLKKYEFDIKQLRRELSAANEEVTQMAALRQTLSQRESKIHELMATASKQDQNIAKLQKERDRLKEKNSTLSSEMTAQRTLAKEYALLQAKLKEMTAQYELLTVPLASLGRKPTLAECHHVLRVHSDGVNRMQSYLMEVLERESKSLADKRQCRVCMDHEINVLLLPCSHYVMCSECADKVQLCPICRCRIDDRKPVYC